jgi:hypothetical protein
MNSFWTQLDKMAQILRETSNEPKIERLREELRAMSPQDRERIADDLNDVSTALSNLATIGTVEPECGPAK